MADSNLPEIRPIEGFENYGVSADGRVWRVRPAINGPGANRPLPWALRQHADKDGYLTVILFREGQRHRQMVAHVVLRAFRGPRPAGLVAAHNNGIPVDNRAENLRWTTQASNIADKVRHGTLARGERVHCAILNEAAVAEIRAVRRVGKKLPNGVLAALSQKHGVSATSIANVRRGKTWRHVDEQDDLAPRGARK